MSFANYPSLNQAPVFITGAASEIGEEILRAFAGQGAKLGFIDMDEERSRTVVSASMRAQQEKEVASPLQSSDPSR